MFIKRGNGKIIAVINEDELTDIQKKKSNDLSIKSDKSSEIPNKKSGD